MSCTLSNDMLDKRGYNPACTLYLISKITNPICDDYFAGPPYVYHNKFSNTRIRIERLTR